MSLLINEIRIFINPETKMKSEIVINSETKMQYLLTSKVNQTDRQTDILLTEKKSHYRLICHSKSYTACWLCRAGYYVLSNI